MCTGVGQRAAAVILVLWLSTAGATLGGLFGGQDSVLRQGNRAWEPDPSWPSPEGPQFRAPEPFDNPWTSSQSSPAEDRDKTLDVQTLTNIINVARYILCECTCCTDACRNPIKCSSTLLLLLPRDAALHGYLTGVQSTGISRSNLLPSKCIWRIPRGVLTSASRRTKCRKNKKRDWKLFFRIRMSLRTRPGQKTN